MYWYIKYPLIGILVLGVLGLFGLLFRSCVRRSMEAEKDSAPVVATETATQSQEQQGAQDGKSGAPAVAQPVTPSAVSDLEGRLNAARKQLDLGYYEAARQIARQILKMEGMVEFSEEWRQVVSVIDEVDKRLMNSSAPAAEKKFHRVVRGDSPDKIARSHYTCTGALFRCNESLRKSSVIQPSQTLCYIEGTWSIRVSKRHFLLMLYLNNELYRVWTVGVGRENRTPAGKFIISQKQVDPPWNPPGRFIPAGDPENVLGTRWMKLTPVEGTDSSLEGYGIHGTTEPDTVGTNCSLGCVRMRNEEVEELYDFIPNPGGSAPPVKVLIEE